MSVTRAAETTDNSRDHRSVSNDSRSWGMVPEHLIHGKAFLRYWPFSRMSVIQ